MPRFVLLYHECPPDYERPSHWDLMLEAGDLLRTWALLQLPDETASETVDAEELDDHRLAYLEYEGAVSGGRGSVRRVDAGTYETIVETGDSLQIRFDGNKLRGDA